MAQWVKPKSAELSKRIPTAASILVILTGSLVLIGWLFNIIPLQNIQPDLPKMTFNTALTHILAAFSLLLYSTKGRNTAALILAIFVTIIGLLTLSEYLFDYHIGIDQLLFRDPAGGVETTIPGRPSPQTAATFLLISISLLLSHTGHPRRILFAQLASLTATFLPILALVGYAYSIPSFFRISAYTGMALHTAFSFILLCLGLLFLRPNLGFMALLTGQEFGSTLSRRLLIVAAGLPPFIGLLTILGRRAGLYSAQLEPVFLTVATGYAFSVAIWFYANALNRLNNQREIMANALQESEAQFRDVVESSPNALILVNEAGQITLVNKQAETMFGYARKALLGQPIEMLVPEQVRQHHDEFRTAYFKGPTSRPMGAGRDLYGIRKDGRQVPVEIGLTPLKTAEGSFVLASIIDISERKEAEQEIAAALAREQAARLETKRLNEELEQRVRERTAQLEAANQELEAFSYSVSHDLRAPLRSIDGFSQALLDDYGSILDGSASHFLNRIRAGSQQMGRLIDELLSLSRVTRSEMKRETINLSQIAQTIVEKLKSENPERHVSVTIAPDLIVQADKQLFQAVLTNLLENAWKFTGKTETAEIELGRLPETDQQPVYFIRDNGAGFEMAYADKLFGAFQRLHTPAEFPGTGVGLATVQRVINRHGGRIWAEAEINQGATFYFTLR
jgi:PAS domain S-box-containing protein